MPSLPPRGPSANPGRAQALSFPAVLVLGVALSTGVPRQSAGQSNAERIRPVLDASLQTALDSARTALDAPGATAAVIFPDGTLWSGASGIAAPDAPATPDTPFELGSITKTYTATLVLQLVADGTLALDAPLARWYPDVPGADRITVRQLLNHTHGLHDPMQEPDFVPAILQNPVRVWTVDDHLSRMGDPGFQPGEGWAYSNIGFHLLGAIVGKATGSTLSDLFEHRLLEPIGLEDTWYAASHPDRRPLAAAFIDVTGDGTPDPVSLMMPWTAFRSSAGAAGAMVATAPDAARWLHALATSEVLEGEEWSQMTSWIDRPDGNRYGLGLLRLELEEGPLVGHKGNSAGYSAGAFHDPASGITVAVLTNAHATDVTSAILALFEIASAPDLERPY